MRYNGAVAFRLNLEIWRRMSPSPPPATDTGDAPPKHHRRRTATGLTGSSNQSIHQSPPLVHLERVLFASESHLSPRSRLHPSQEQSWRKDPVLARRILPGRRLRRVDLCRLRIPRLPLARAPLVFSLLPVIFQIQPGPYLSRAVCSGQCGERPPLRGRLKRRGPLGVRMGP